MDKKQKHPSNPIPADKVDTKTQHYINLFEGLFSSAPQDPPFNLLKICDIVTQRADQIKLNIIYQLIKRSQLSVNITNFALIGTFRILITLVKQPNINNQIAHIKKVWDIICYLLQKIIKITQDPDNTNKTQAAIARIATFNEGFINYIVQLIIKVLLIDAQDVKQIKINEFFIENRDLKDKLLRLKEIIVIQGCNQIIKLYTLVLCLNPVKVELVIMLTTIFQRDPKTQKQLRNNTYKLQKWLIKRKLTLCNIFQLLELIKNPEREPYFTNKLYLKPQGNKRITFDISYQPLIPGILSQLCNIQDTHDKKEASNLISFLISKFCLESQYLLESILQLYHNQNNQQTLESMFKYIQFHYSNQISIKKMKLLLQFIKDQSSFYKQQQNLNKQASLYKLRKFVELLVIISKYHLEQLHVVQFVKTSNISLNKVSLSKESIVMFIQITRYEDKMRIISLDFSSKQKLHITLELNMTGQHTKRQVVVEVESVNSDNSSFKTLLKQPVAYQNDNVKNQFLFVLKIVQNKLQLCVNSSYFQLALEDNNKSTKSINIDNIQLGKVNSKKKSEQSNVSSFKGRLKMFYIFDRMNENNIAFIFPQFTEKLRSKLSEFTKTFEIQPIIKMVKGEKLFMYPKAAQKQSFFGSYKYSEQRTDVKVNIISSISEIIEELESYDIFLYLISELDYKLEKQSTKMICDIFDTMKYIAINDEKELFLKWIEGKQEEKELMGFSYFLLMLFRKNTKQSQEFREFRDYKKSQSYKQMKQAQQKIVSHFLSFIFCYQEFEWYGNKSIQNNRIRYQMLEIQIIVRLLLNFQIWRLAVQSVQLRILKEIQKRLNNKRILEMIKTLIMNDYRMKKLSTQGKTILSHKKYKSHNRVLNGLLMALILYNRDVQNKQIKQSRFRQEPKQSEMVLNCSNYSLAKSTFHEQLVCIEWAQQIQSVQFKIAELIQRVINIPNQNNNLVDQQVLVSQIKTILFCIISHHSKDHYKNSYAVHLLLNIFNVKLTEQSRYLRFFIKDVSPFYHQNHCLLIAILIKTLPPNQTQILKMILQILSRIISIIQQKCLKHNQKQLGNEVSSRFIRQALRGYRQHSTFQPEYFFCFFNWILQNKFEQKHIKFLIKQIQKHRRNIDSLKKLQQILENIEPKILIYLTSNIDFYCIFAAVTGFDRQYESRSLILANKLFAKIYQYNTQKANQLYNFYLQICRSHNFSENNKSFSKVHPYQDETEVLSICQYLSSCPNLKPIKNPNDIIAANKETTFYLGGTLSHHLIKCQISIPLVDKLQSTSNIPSFDSYYCIDNLVEYFLPDYLLSKIMSLCLSEKGEIKNDLLTKSLIYISKFKDRIIKNIQVFNNLSSITSEFIQNLSHTNAMSSKQLELQKPQNIKLAKIQELKKSYVQHCFIINQEYVKETHGQYLMMDLLTNLLESNTATSFREKIKQSQDKVKQIMVLIETYSTKDMLWANKYYQISLSSLESNIQVNKDQQSSEILKKQLYNQAKQIIFAEQQQIDNNFLISQQEWKKIVSKNLHWAEKGIPLGAIFKIDLHQCPNFYHLNIQRTKPNNKRKIFPRKFKQKQQQKVEPTFIKRESIRDRTKTATSNPSSHSQQQLSTVSTKRSLLESTVAQNNTTTLKYKKYLAQYVTQRGIYFGNIMFNAKTKQIQFISCKEFERPKERVYQLSTSKYHRLPELKIKVIKINQKCSVFTRRYILRHTALEIFNEDKAFFFNLFKRKERDQFLNSLKGIQKIINRRKQFINKQFTNKWESGEINNFEYLMWINRYSGRTYNDLSQFPVFPWIIADYKSNSGELAMRNLQLPMGKLNQQRYQGYKLRMIEGGFSEEEKFLYGTFYSNPTVLYNFFIRLQPFLTLHWDHQGQKIDHADRLFSGIQEQYSSAINNTSDVKQLTPEFYYWPEFLKNRNQFQLGKKQKGDAVNDVILPAWAKFPEQFIFKMRVYLQSKEVTETLHHWIDLIFGDKSPRKAALQNGNLFHPLMYQMDRIKQDQDKDIFTQMENDSEVQVAQLTISQFGQVPETLFTKPHVQKKGRQKMNLDVCQLSTPQFKDVFKLLPCSSGAAIVSKKYVTFVSSFVIEQRNQKQYKLKQVPCFNNGELKYYSYCIINDQNHTFSELAAGRLSIYQGAKKIELFTRQIQSITHVITKDLTLITSIRNKLCFYKISPDYSSVIEKQRVSGHNDRIYKIVVNEGIDIVLSVDSDNLVLIHYLSTLKFLRDFQLKLISGEQIKQIRIHDMGYFLFLTSQSRILLYSYLGDLLLETDFVYPLQNQFITNIRWMSEYHPIILLSSSKGYIYKVSWLAIYKENTKFPYRQYVLQKQKGKQLLHQCQHYSYNDLNMKGKVLKKQDQENREILDFFIVKGFNQTKSQKMTYILMVLYKSGHLRTFREMKVIRKNFENNALFNKMAFTSQ